ncbi:MAG: ASKHA domain-containing protein [Clostridiales Family XIII bacterium]|jgi:uncharacterized 2Fe-2S/4Fe-4S cluster protein (DUF4445 family)|nr:ASKHA domain-containing protein [Clostridiales Family XIII bacterium]
MDNLGIAFDVGTTTLTGALWDLDSKALIGRTAIGNPQAKFGADIIFRLSNAMKGDAERQRLQASAVEGMNRIMGLFEERHGIRRADIKKITAVGNTVMRFLLLGEDPSPLAAPPYAAAQDAATVEAAALGIGAAPGAALYMPPGLGGYVGSDITAGLLATDFCGLPGCTLFVDVGTNGEIALCAGGRLLVCSAAAGPAFEGASLSMGMRAHGGAVERAEIYGGDLHITTVGGKPPRGVCGSGAISIVAALLDAGILEGTGRMRTAGELREMGLGEALCSRVTESGQVREFVLCGQEGGARVAFTQKDVREMQMAKAAIAAGIKALLARAGVDGGDVSGLLLAGTFGNNIDVRSARRIGLFAGVGGEIVSKGNAAGDGASLMLIGGAEAAEAGRIAGMAEHVQLADEPGFQDLLVGEMDFQ